LRSFIEKRILSFFNFKIWLWCSLINNKLISFIIVLRSSVDVFNWRFKITYEFSSRDVVAISKCNTRLMKHFTKCFAWVKYHAHKNSIVYLVTIWRRSKKWKRKKELWKLINSRRLISFINSSWYWSFDWINDTKSWHYFFFFFD
jgi:hypothetical protein